MNYFNYRRSPFLCTMHHVVRLMAPCTLAILVVAALTGCDFQPAVSAVQTTLADSTATALVPTAVATLPPAIPSPTLVPEPSPTLVPEPSPTTLPKPSPSVRPKSSPVPKVTIHPVVKQPPATLAVPSKPLPTTQVMAIGDSVMLGARSALLRLMPSLQVDAAVSRQIGAGIAILQARRAAGTLSRTVVVHLGTNGSFFPSHMDTLLHVLDGYNIVLVNLKVPRVWEASNNSVIAAGVARYPHAVLADWHSASIGHPEYFAADGFHLTAAGAQVYATLIANALRRLS